MRRKDLIWKVIMSAAVALTMLPVQARAEGCEHQRVYSVEENILKEICALNCGYEERAWLELNSEEPLVYTGKEIKPLVMKKTDGWMGGTPEIIYANNVKAAEVPEESEEAELQSADPADQTDEEAEQKESGEEIKTNMIPSGTLTIEGVSVSKSFPVEKAPLTVTVVATAAYGDEEPQYEVQYTGFVGEDTAETAIVGEPVITSDYAIGAPVGSEFTLSVDLTGVSSENYVLTAQNGSFKVEARAVEIDWGSLTFPYDGEAHRPEPVVKNVVAEEDVTPVVNVEAQINAGTYEIAVVDLDGADKDNYKLPEECKTQFEISRKELTVTLDASTFVYDGEVHKPTATVSGWVEGDDIQWTAEGEGTDAGTYTVKVTLSGEKSGNYYLPNGGEISFNIQQAEQDAPAGLQAVHESILNKGDGKITGVTTEMEYKRKDTEDGYSPISETEIANLTSGTYLVRYAEKEPNYAASGDAEVTVTAGKALTVSVPENQVGYTLIAEPVEVGWNGESKLTFQLLDGYTKDDFAIKVGEEIITLEDDNTYTIENIQENKTVTVEGVVDQLVPEAVITVTGKNTEELKRESTTLVDDITFEDFFKQIKVTIAGTDASGIKSIEYYESSTKVEDPATIDKWKPYPNAGITVSGSDRNLVIYAKVTDNSENITYVSSNGMVFDRTLPVIKVDGKTTTETRMTCYTTKEVTVTDNNLKEVRLNGVAKTLPITAAGNVDKVYLIRSEDKAGNLNQVTISMKKIASLDDTIEKLTKDTMKPENKTEVNTVLQTVKNLLKENPKETEADALEAIRDDCEELLENINYSITSKAADLKWTKSSGKDLEIKTDAGSATLKNVRIDDKILAKTNYEYEDGTLTLKKSYLQKTTTTVGKHTIKLEFNDGETGGEDEIQILKAGTNPKTGDNAHLPVWCLTAGISLAGLAAVLADRKRRYQA